MPSVPPPLRPLHRTPSSNDSRQPGHSGYPSRGREFKISLFADDIILTLTRPRISLPNLQRELERYGALSGYKTNTSKSMAMPINMPGPEALHLQSVFPYHWERTSLKYLGVQLTPNFASLYQANFPPLYSSIRALIHKWKSHQISLLGRIAAIKMVILPKLLYLFQTLPIPVPYAHLRALQADLLRYVWNYKRHRIPRSVMTAARTEGGLAFPDLVKYYQASQLRAVASWFPQKSYNRWTEVEKIWLAPIHPNNLLWNANATVEPGRLLGSMRQLQSTWRKLAQDCRLTSDSSLLTSFLYNPKLPTSLTHQMSWPWASRNLFHFGHLVDPRTRTLHSFTELQAKHDIPRQAFFSYLQIRHYAHTMAPRLLFSKPTPFERIILEGTARRGLISDIYQILNEYPLQTKGKHTYMLRWEKELGGELEEDEWRAVWRQAAKSSICTLYKEKTYKVLFFWYLTPDVLHRIYPSTSDRCWRCNQARGTLFHIYWTCPLIVQFWTRVQELLTRLVEAPIPLSPKLFLLGLSQPRIAKPYKKLLRHITTAARCLIALYWKKPMPPPQEALYARVKDVELMEKMTARIRDRLEDHDLVWERWHAEEDPP